MSKYTTEVRFICETAAGLVESVGYSQVEEVIQEGQIDEELVEGQIIAATDEALDALDGYYVNLTHDEQAKVDTWIQELKALLTF